MLKGIWSFGKKKAKKHLNVSTWANFDGLIESTSWVKNLLSRIYHIPRGDRSEDFNVAMQRLNLDEAGLRERRAFFIQMTSLYMVCFVMMLVYGHFYIFKLTQNAYMLLAVYIVSLLLLAQAFRYSYWTCQIAKRKLGCSILEWFLWLVRIRP